MFPNAAARPRDRARILCGMPLALALVSVPACAADPFEGEMLAEGVRLFRPVEPSSGRTNSLVVEQEDGLVVLDAQPSPKAARELLAAVRKWRDRPVKFLVLSHPHAEAAGGASAFPDSTLVIASEGYRRAVLGAEHDFGAETRALAADPEAWTPPPRRQAKLVLSAKAVLADTERNVEIMPAGHAHSSGDLLVFLPASDIMYVGSLVFPNGTPYARGARMTSWVGALNHLVRQAPRLVVGLSGPPLQVEEIRRQRDALAWLRGQVDYAIVDRPPLEELKRMVLEHEEIDERFPAGPTRAFLPQLVDEVIEEVVEERVKRGLM